MKYYIMSWNSNIWYLQAKDWVSRVPQDERNTFRLWKATIYDSRKKILKFMEDSSQSFFSSTHQARSLAVTLVLSYQKVSAQLLFEGGPVKGGEGGVLRIMFAYLLFYYLFILGG